MISKAKTVEAYLQELPPERRTAISAVRAVILKNLGKGFAEGMSYGMIGYFVPHSIYPAGYHCDPKLPLPFAGLASQKNGIALHLMCLYMDAAAKARFTQAWTKTGRKLDMGAACVRFKTLEDAALEVIGEAIAAVSVEGYIKRCESMLKGRKQPVSKPRVARPSRKKGR